MVVRVGGGLVYGRWSIAIVFRQTSIPISDAATVLKFSNADRMRVLHAASERHPKARCINNKKIDPFLIRETEHLAKCKYIGS